MEATIADLKQTVDALRTEVVRLSGKSHFDPPRGDSQAPVVDLFSEDPETYVQFLGGRYLTKEGVRRLYVGRFAAAFAAGRNGPVHGFLLDHPQMQGIVNVDYSLSTPGTNGAGARAKGRFRSLMQAGVHISQAQKHPRGFCQWFEGGIYENEYIKDKDGQWRILHLRYFPFWHGDVEHGWGYKVSGFVPFPTKTFPEDPMGPDMVVSSEQRMLWPDTRVVPFHYNHPITGEPVKDEDMQAPAFGEKASGSLPPLTLKL
ncbi:hypothetical protein EDB81DRAFT_842722 [Dactylonectria macrodidyma]|uniref:SnoaL-like domain-containing protein n=1 Tax=Dactylonectria macrodidyma TaxID=307937 RepID=A0A9P9ERR9_9HYPO|nr:hypothetical protein EDB81DRAFT_842722 [Dactylonectria macrodidyma]